MPYQVYRTNSSNWHLITSNEAGFQAANQAIGGQFGPFVFLKEIDDLGVIGMDKPEDVNHNLLTNSYHLQNSKIEFTES